MRSLGALSVAALLAVAACSGNDATPTPSSSPPPTIATTMGSATTGAPSTTTTTTTTAPPGPVVVARAEVTGKAEIVFDWTTDQCEPEHIPDIAARAFRDAEDRVQLIVGHYVNYRMIGPSLNEVVTDCGGPLLSSDFDPDPTQFNDSEWIGAPYTLDGTTVYAVVHNEYRGDTHSASRPDQCPSGDRNTCLDTSFTMQISTDGGDTYTDIEDPPGHVIATLPHLYDDEGVPSGVRQPSNIIERDGYYYLFGNISDYPTEEQWVCAMRTDDLADPDAWRFWTGSGFTGTFIDPYREAFQNAERCHPLDPDALGVSVQETVVWIDPLDRYVMMGISADPYHHGPPARWGVYYSFSDDLIEWTTRRLLLELPVTASVADVRHDQFYAYPSVIDPGSPSRNFETSSSSAYLYITLLNEGAYSLDRDLVRYPIEFSEVELVGPPEWDFDSDGDTGDWHPLWNLEDFAVVDGELVMHSTGEDPQFGSTTIDVPASHDEMRIRMRVSGAGETIPGEVFFSTDRQRVYNADTLHVFEVVADGDYHDYVFDFSDNAEWHGVITTLRIDPAPDAGRDIAIDRIWFP